MVEGVADTFLILFAVATDRNGKTELFLQEKQNQTRRLSIMKTMTIDEVRNLPPLTAEEIEEAMNFKNTDYEDCPKQSKEELAEFRPWYEFQKE